MKHEFIDYLQSQGWKLVSDSEGFFKFDRVGPYQVYIRNSSIEFLKFNLDFDKAGEPFFSHVTSFTGLESLSLSSFIKLVHVMGIVKHESNVRVIGDLKVDQQMHCTAIAEQILKN